LSAETVLLDADLPNLLAVEIARDVRLQLPAVLIIFTTARDSAAVPADELLIRKPQRFDDFLALLELVIERGSEGASELKIEN
jgi:DNA-binding response OmpR family regulator